MTMHVCLEPGCPTPTHGTRCTQHERTQDRARGKTSTRGYGTTHQRIRNAWQRKLDHGERITCWRCGTPIDPSSWHLGHDDNDRTKYRGPECVPCNTATTSRRTT